MPLLTDRATEADWVEPDTVPRQVATCGIVSERFGAFELQAHSHAKGQILLVQHGALSCEMQDGLWIVPPRSAVWIPGGVPHAIKASGTLEGYCAFIARDACEYLPARCCALSVTPLLRELLLRAALLPLFYEEGGPNARLMAVLLDEVATARPENLHLPVPADTRLRRMLDLMLQSPTERGTLRAWAGRMGLSTRTLERLMNRQTGMSFARWRRQLSVMLAVERLAAGASIQQVAADLGYESVPGFVTMFRRVLGTSPGRYMIERHSAGHGRPDDRDRDASGILSD